MLIKNLSRIFKICLLFIITDLSAQPNCSPKIFPFESGEEIIYDIEYLMGKTWVTAGKVRFKVEDSIVQNINCLYIEGKGRTLKNYDWFFKVRDKYSTFISKETSLPIHFSRNVREGDFHLDYNYDFDYIKNKAYISESRKKGNSNDTIDIISCSFDIMSSVYYSRAINFNSYKYNDTIPLNIILDKQVFKDLNIVYKGKEVVINQNKKKINCIHFQIKLIEGTIFKANETMDVFVSDDENRVPIYVEGQIIVGAVRVFSKSIKGTKIPIRYLN